LIIQSRANEKSSEGIETIGEQWIELNSFAEIIILNDQSQKKLSGELIIQTRTKDKAIEKIGATIDRVKLRVSEIWLNNESL